MLQAVTSFSANAFHLYCLFLAWISFEISRCYLTGLLARSAVSLYAAALRDDTEDIRSVPLGSAAVVIGSEGRGVSQPVLDACRATLKIPMRDRCESLNAAVAASVVLWEGWR